MGVVVIAGIAVAQQAKPPNPRSVSTTIDRMTAAGKSQREIATYVFDTHGCRSCHTTGEDGKLGFTGRGKQVGRDFEGCVTCCPP